MAIIGTIANYRQPLRLTMMQSKTWKGGDGARWHNVSTCQVGTVCQLVRLAQCVNSSVWLSVSTRQVGSVCQLVRLAQCVNLSGWLSVSTCQVGTVSTCQVGSVCQLVPLSVNSLLVNTCVILISPLSLIRC